MPQSTFFSILKLLVVFDLSMMPLLLFNLFEGNGLTLSFLSFSISDKTHPKLIKPLCENF